MHDTDHDRDPDRDEDTADVNTMAITVNDDGHKAAR